MSLQTININERDVTKNSLSIEMAQCEQVKFLEGEDILKMDEESDFMYYIKSGSVQVEGMDGKVFAEMSTGAFFGEVGLVFGVKRTATIRAKEDVQLSKITKQNLDQIQTESNEIIRTAKERHELHLRRIVTKNLENCFDEKSGQSVSLQQENSFSNSNVIQSEELKQIKLFATLDESILARLAALLKKKICFQTQEYIIKVSDKAESMFFLVLGEVEIITEFGEVIESVKSSNDITQWFGEVGLLEGLPRTANVKSITDCTVYEIKKDAIKEFMELNPTIKEKIEESSRDRLQAHLMRNIERSSSHQSIKAVMEQLCFSKAYVSFFEKKDANNMKPYDVAISISNEFSPPLYNVRIMDGSKKKLDYLTKLMPKPIKNKENSGFIVEWEDEKAPLMLNFFKFDYSSNFDELHNTFLKFSSLTETVDLDSEELVIYEAPQKYSKMKEFEQANIKIQNKNQNKLNKRNNANKKLQKSMKLKINENETVKSAASTLVTTNERDDLVYFHSQEEELPIHSYCQKILEHVKSNNVTIIHGDTGSGKTTVIPRLLIEDAVANGLIPRIIVCQPRRIACLQITERVKEQLKNKPFTTGHRIMNDVDDKNASIVFSTTGYLVQWLSKNPKAFLDVTHIVLDEAHERSIDMDLLALLVKRHMKTVAIKLVIMSATLDIDIFGTYFKSVATAKDESILVENEDCDELVLEFENLEVVKSPLKVLHVGVKRFHVEHVFLEKLPTMFKSLKMNYGTLGERAISYISSQVKVFDKFTESSGIRRQLVTPKIDNNGYLCGVILCLSYANMCDQSTSYQYRDNSGVCILVFLPGENEIMQWKDTLEENFGNSTFRKDIRLHILHSNVPQAAQKDAFIPVEDGCLKIVLCTNIAESSITIPDATIIIDYGLRRQMEYNSSRGIQQLALGWISKASSIQRLGRAGRTSPGTCIAMYTRTFLDQQRHHEPPEIAQISLEGTVLNVKDIFPGNLVRDVLNELVEPPEKDQLDQAFLNLRQSGAIAFSSSGKDIEGDVTFFGRIAGSLPVDLIQARVLLFAQAIGFPMEGVILSAALSSTDIFSMPSPFFISERKLLEEKLALTWAGKILADDGSLSEPIALLNIFKRWLSCPINKRFDFLRSTSVNLLRFRQFRVLVCTLARRLAEMIEREATSTTANETRNSSIKSVKDLLKLVEESGRSDCDKNSGAANIAFTENVDVLRSILLLACGSKTVYCVTNENRTFDTMFKTFTSKLSDLQKEKKKSKKNKKSEIKNTPYFWASSIQPSNYHNEDLALFKTYVPSAEDTMMGPKFVPGACIKEEDVGVKQFSYSDTLEATVIFKKPDRNKTGFVKFKSETPDNLRNADIIRKILAWTGVERVFCNSTFAAIEFNHEGKLVGNTLPSTVQDIPFGFKFLHHLCQGKRDATLYVPTPKTIMKNVTNEESVLGKIIFPTSSQWKSLGFLDGDPGIKVFWRSPLNDVFLSFKKKPSIMMGVCSSALAVTNGQAFSVSVNGVTLIPIHEDTWKMRLLSVTQLNNNTSILVVGSSPETIIETFINGLALGLKLTANRLDAINKLRAGVNELLLYGTGFNLSGLSNLVFENLEIASLSNFQTTSSGYFQKSLLQEVKSKFEDNFSFFSNKKSDSQLWKHPQDTPFKFGEKNKNKEEFSFNFQEKVPRVTELRAVYSPFEWPKYEPPMKNYDDYTDSSDMSDEESVDDLEDDSFEEDYDDDYDRYDRY